MIRFTRNVHLHIKDGKDKEFVTLLNNEILPLLKKQTGFQEELTLLDGRHAVAISMWDERKNAEKYSTSLYPELLKKLNPVLEGAPRVETYDVGVTTLTH